MTASRLLVQSSDGVRIACQRSGTGPPLVLVHGTTADHTRWAQVAPLFAERSTVYTMDRRGRGGSGDADEYSLEQEGDDVAAVVDAIGEPAALVGHSYGALCCLEAALRTPNLRRLILYEPPLPTGREIVPAHVRATIDAQLQRGEREAALLTFFREVVGVPEGHLALMREHPAWQGRIRAAHTLGREMRVESTYRPAVDRFLQVEVPTLLLVGSDSPPFFHDAVRLLSAALPNSGILEFPGQQHVAMDTAPALFVEAVGTFALS